MRGQWDFSSGASVRLDRAGFNPPAFFLGGLFGGGSETVTQSLDPRAQAYVEQQRRQALAGADFLRNYGPTVAGPTAQSRYGAGVIRGMGSAFTNPLFQQFIGANQGLMQGLDFAGQQFGEGTLDAYMNPYQSRVIDAMNQQFNLSGDYARQQAAQEATKAGAFGGSRSGVLQAGALAANERARNQAVSGALQQGYNQAYNQWMGDRAMAAQLGSQGLGGIFSGLQYGNQFDLTRGQANLQAGEYERALRERQLQEPLQRQIAAQQLVNASLGPYGTTQTTEKSGGSLFGNLLGGAVSLFGGPLGGPIMGALGSLFGGGGDAAPAGMENYQTSDYARYRAPAGVFGFGGF